MPYRVASPRIARETASGARETAAYGRGAMPAVSRETKRAAAGCGIAKKRGMLSALSGGAGRYSGVSSGDAK